MGSPIFWADPKKIEMGSLHKGFQNEENMSLQDTQPEGWNTWNPSIPRARAFTPFQQQTNTSSTQFSAQSRSQFGSVSQAGVQTTKALQVCQILLMSLPVQVFLSWPWRLMNGGDNCCRFILVGMMLSFCSLVWSYCRVSIGVTVNITIITRYHPVSSITTH